MIQKAVEVERKIKKVFEESGKNVDQQINKSFELVRMNQWNILAMKMKIWNNISALEQFQKKKYE